MESFFICLCYSPANVYILTIQISIICYLLDASERVQQLSAPKKIPLEFKLPR